MITREKATSSGLVILLVLLWLGFLFHRSPRFPGSLTGGLLGISALIFMLVPLFYYFVKRIPPLKRFFLKKFSFQKFLEIHIYSGILAGILGVLHSGHKFESPLGIMLMALTIIVIMSGFTGRYLLSYSITEVADKKKKLKVLGEFYDNILNNSSQESFAYSSPVEAPLSVAPKTVMNLVDAMADTEYTIKTHETFKYWFSKWLNIHIFLSLTLYFMLFLHIWSELHFGIRWFE